MDITDENFKIFFSNCSFISKSTVTIFAITATPFSTEYTPQNTHRKQADNV